MSIALAPMEGVIDSVMRDLLTSIGGIDQCTTEFIRVTDRELPDHVFYRYCPELKSGGKTPGGIPVFLQLLGSRPEEMAINAQKAVALGAIGIDLNFGCPAKTVNRHDGGASLLKDPQRLFDVTSRVRQNLPSSIPLTAKVRLGFEHKKLCREIAQAIDQSGAQALTVHARTKLELYRPPAHWEFIALMRESVRIPIVANGDIWDLDAYQQCKQISGCQAIALGRPLLARPDLALRIKSYEKGIQLNPWSWEEIMNRCLIPSFERNRREYHDHFALCRMKQWLRQLTLAYSEALILFERVKKIKNIDDMKISFLRPSAEVRSTDCVS